MLAEVHGQVLSTRLDAVVVAVGGMGLLVRTTPRTLAGLRTGSTARLATSLVVREDSLTLFGFAEDDERDVFEVLQTVTGVGPRLALAVMAVMEPDDLRRAVAAEDVNALVRVPGIGRKGAQRMLLELGDRLGPPHGTTRAGGGAPVPASPPADPVREQVVAALVGLGWAQKQSEDAVDAVIGSDEEPDGAGVGGSHEPADLLRTALRGLART
jgi:Holliday junction DNA helicase RuvA